MRASLKTVEMNCDNLIYMKYRFCKAALLVLLLVGAAFGAQAQNYNLKIKLVDKGTKEPVGYATVAVTPDGKTFGHRMVLFQ